MVTSAQSSSTTRSMRTRCPSLTLSSLVDRAAKLSVTVHSSCARHLTHDPSERALVLSNSSASPEKKLIGGGDHCEGALDK
eukprot:CAMPEP_0119141072 /NCGR_PEP_ID=MMETSP1310-20130426/30356_1 /TAXON_ID=464262 /ORGANISM="Genus nov. species nov., Strain RCC2339" /LENGTH=80 /DNA_ID=CAMNT_0007132491 /DNA_START=175 /DNA_END=417 /DNA_ORIENTATION=-